MEATPVIITYAPLILAAVSLLGIAVTVSALLVGRVFRLGKFFADFATLQGTVAEQQGTLVGLQNTSAEQQGAIVDLQKTVADQQGMLVDIQKTIADQQRAIVDLQKTMADQQRAIVGLQETVVALGEAVVANQVEMQKMNGRLETVEANQEDLKRAVADNRTDIDRLRREVRDGFEKMEIKIDAGLQELRGYFISHLEHHAGYPADDD